MDRAMEKRLTKSATAIAVYRTADTLVSLARDRKNCDCIFGMNHIALLGSCLLRQAMLKRTRSCTRELYRHNYRPSPRNRARINRQTFFRLIFSRSKILFILESRDEYFSRNILTISRIILFMISTERERERERGGGQSHLSSRLAH